MQVQTGFNVAAFPPGAGRSCVHAGGRHRRMRRDASEFAMRRLGLNAGGGAGEAE